MEPKYLIGGPAAPKVVAAPGIVHAFNHSPDMASSAGACGEQGFRGPADTVTCPDCVTLTTLPQRVPGAALVTEPAPELIAPQEDTVTVGGLFRGYDAQHWAQEAKAAEGSLDHGKRRRVKEYQLCAELAQVNGIMEFPALFTVGGAPVPQAALVPVRRTGRLVWRIGTGKAVTWFHPSQDRTGAVRAKRDMDKGFLVGLVRTVAQVGTNVNGSAWIEPDPQAPVEILDNGSARTQYQDW